MNVRFSNRLRCILVVGLLSCLAIVEVRAADRVVLVAGGSGDEGGPATEAKLVGPFGVDFDRPGNAFLVEIAGHRVLKIDRRGTLTRVAGNGMKGDGGDGGPAMQAEFNGMHSLAVSHRGDIFVADTWNHRVRKIEARTGMITSLAGTGNKGYSGDGGPAARAEFGGIYCVALDPNREQLVLTDLDNRRIRVVDLTTGIVSTSAGNGHKGIPADESDARNAPLVDPRAAVPDSHGNLWILERAGNALRVVNRDGKIRTVIGDSKGDVTLNGPKHLCLDRDGNVIIADTENHRILKYLPREARTVPVAGTGKKGADGVGGPPDQLQLNQPHGVTIGPSGELYIVDSSNNRVLKIEPAAKRKPGQVPEQVSAQGAAYLDRLMKNTPFGTNQFDFDGLRKGMGTRRKITVEGVQTRAVQIGEIPAEWVLAPGTDTSVRLLYLHGGGFVSGSGGYYLPLAAHISAAAKCAVLVIDYRLAPEHRFPAGLDDCVAAHDWLRSNGPAGPNPARATFVAGDSAGGNLTLAAVLALRDRKLKLPHGAISISPAADLTLTSPSLQSVYDPIISSKTMPIFRDHYLGGQDPAQPLASPVYGDYRGLPPLLIQAGEHEMLRDDSIRVAKKAQTDGIDVKLEIWPGMFHVFQSHDPLLPEGKEAVDHIAQFIQALTPAQ